MSAAPLTATEVRHRFLVLRALRWLPTGAILPVLVLLLLDRGLSLGQIGLVAAAQGAVVLVLELPTGGLADTWGRRPVLAWAAVIELLAVALLVVADTLPLLVAVFALQGIYRALESGPLDAWYVDSAQAADPGADIEGGLAGAGVVTGLALAAGTLATGGLVALDPLPAVGALVTPLLLAIILRAVDLAAILRLLREPAAPTPRPVSTRSVGTVIATAVGVVRRSRVLRAVLLAEVLWAAGMVAFEVFTPARLGETTGSAETAAALMGPATAAGWAAAAAGAALVPRLVRLVGVGGAGALLRVGQGIAVAGIALAAGPAGVVIAFVTTMAVHGAANPVHQGLLHRGVEGAGHRATVVSVNGMLAQAAGATGGIALGALADAVDLRTAVLAGGALLALPAPLYLMAGRWARPTSEAVAAPTLMR